MYVYSEMLDLQQHDIINYFFYILLTMNLNFEKYCKYIIEHFVLSKNFG